MPVAEPKTGLDEFFAMLDGVRKVALSAAAGLIALPLAAGLAGFAPPWPPGLVVITSLMELVVLLVVFQTLAKAQRSAASKVIIWSAILVFVTSAVYLVLNAAFVYQIPNDDTRVVMGCGLSDNAQLILKSQGLNPTDVCPGEFSLLMSSAQYETDKVWTRLSITAIKSALAISWFGSFGALSFLVGVFVAFQRRQVVRASRTTVKRPTTSEGA
ncbi:hypothetical protein [Achromobacter piechaudii]|uniref:Uncharacterized protein n=1 Tax=Achromobacter piechaudii ATCC 43553 TaxID=742159 RepID=D4XCI9_9BURK|nr:hypothetical protein [Achromobacter piechaudii]EFF75500.1 hypothetical protein HMPREF0004_3186 [Achromobacter piechaudii ATCC 43553]